MSLVVWRVLNNKYTHNPASGEGADKYGGRWNNVGTPVIYAAESLALAIIEVGLDPDDVDLLNNYSKISFEIDESFIKHVSDDQLPDGWNTIPAEAETKAIGDDWVVSKLAAVLSVPSVFSPNERCYVLNPAHPDFSKIVVGAAQSI